MMSLLGELEFRAKPADTGKATRGHRGNPKQDNVNRPPLPRISSPLFPWHISTAFLPNPLASRLRCVGDFLFRRFGRGVAADHELERAISRRA